MTFSPISPLWTPWRIFDPGAPDPFLLRAGDRVRFVPVSADDARDIAARVAEGALRPTPENAAP